MLRAAAQAPLPQLAAGGRSNSETTHSLAIALTCASPLPCCAGDLTTISAVLLRACKNLNMNQVGVVRCQVWDRHIQDRRRVQGWQAVRHAAAAVRADTNSPCAGHSPMCSRSAVLQMLRPPEKLIPSSWCVCGCVGWGVRGLGWCVCGGGGDCAWLRLTHKQGVERSAAVPQQPEGTAAVLGCVRSTHTCPACKVHCVLVWTPMFRSPCMFAPSNAAFAGAGGVCRGEARLHL